MVFKLMSSLVFTTFIIPWDSSKVNTQNLRGLSIGKNKTGLDSLLVLGP